MGTVILAYADPTEYLNHRNDWVVYNISELQITFNIYWRRSKKSTKERLRTLEGIESYQDPNEDEGDYENN